MGIDMNAAHFIKHGTRPPDLDPSIEWPVWADNLDSDQVAQLRAYLEADEFCACGCLDEEHDENSVCMNNNDDPDSFASPHACYAYNPVQK
jgi:hypothetical protein